MQKYIECIVRIATVESSYKACPEWERKGGFRSKKVYGGIWVTEENTKLNSEFELDQNKNKQNTP